MVLYVFHNVQYVGVTIPFVKGYGDEEVPLMSGYPFGYFSWFVHYLI